ncbi:MAG: ribosome recycling factor [Fibrobacterales bacterium]|nr:ribosome recycling factor [Fibrobacterales bacterium]MBP5188107.1 ribosome recycling factor [Fibrobacterales bacterium]MBP5350627.1 ribosome recycling factor [Fibrobacterales bacterium]
MASVEERMEKAVENCQREWAKIRTGLATPNILDGINVDYYGTPTPILHLASVKATEPRVLSIIPWEKPMLGPIEKAIFASNLGLTPTNDGSCIRLTFPMLTGERREELTKVVRKVAEEGRVAVRNVRRDENESLKKQSKEEDWPEDMLKGETDKVQKITDRFIAKIDELCAAKEADILKV